MDIDLAFLFSVAAIIVMLYCLGLVVSLRKEIPGGLIGKHWATLQLLVILFTVGYFATPFASLLPEDVLRLIVALIFLFGAIYVVITVKLIRKIIQVLAS